MTDYRNRPPVDAPRRTVRSVLTGLPFVAFVMTFGGWTMVGIVGTLLAVAFGWHQ